MMMMMMMMSMLMSMMMCILFVSMISNQKICLGREKIILKTNEFFKHYFVAVRTELLYLNPYTLLFFAGVYKHLRKQVIVASFETGSSCRLREHHHSTCMYYDHRTCIMSDRAHVRRN